MKTKTLVKRASLALLVPGLFVASACATGVSPESRGQLIAQLEEAQTTDRINALDPTVGPVALGDLMLHADRAQSVMDELSRGSEVSRDSINDALFVPPKRLSEKQRGQLIGQIEKARWLDERGEAEWNRCAYCMQDFRVQEIKCDRALTKLKSNQPISWDELKLAQEVPWDP